MWTAELETGEQTMYDSICMHDSKTGLEFRGYKLKGPESPGVQVSLWFFIGVLKA